VLSVAKLPNEPAAARLERRRVAVAGRRAAVAGALRRPSGPQAGRPARQAAARRI